MPHSQENKKGSSIARSDMKRILIFSLTYEPYVGGAEVALREITNRVSPAAYAFDMITLRFDSALPACEKVGNITVHRIGFTTDAPRVSDRQLPLVLKIAKILFPFTAFWKACMLHRARPFDAIWAMMANHAAFGALLFAWTHPHVPYFLELQDGNNLAEIKTRQPILRFMWFFYKRIYLDADCIKAVSSFIEKLAREVGYSGPLCVIPNGVDTRKFSAPIADEKLAALRTHYGKKDGDVFLFTASRLVLSRGVEDSIRALSFLPEHVKLFVAGDGEDLQKLEHIAEEMQVSHRVIFAGHKNHDELPALMKMCDIFVRPSLLEGFGNAFIEAFAAGLPVVATRVGGIPDFLFDPEVNPDKPPTGMFCEVHNPESIANAVMRLIENPTLRAQIILNARELATEKYDWDLIAHQMQRKVFDRIPGSEGR